MHYEIYIDSLFLLNFTMNLYLLLLLNKSLGRTATRKRLLAGAAMGGMGYCLMLLLPVGNALVKILFSVVLVNGGTLFWVFRPHSVKAFLKILESGFLYSFLMGGGLFLLMNQGTFFRKYMMSVTGILLCGGLLWLLFYNRAIPKRKVGTDICKVELSGGGESRITVQAIVDTGNSLKEPISGKPVSVLDKTVFDILWKDEPPKVFRAIPYRSVGCEKGIMRGYEVPEMRIEQDGISKVCRNVYIGISDKPVSVTEHYRMLIHPGLLEK